MNILRKMILCFLDNMEKLMNEKDIAVFWNDFSYIQQATKKLYIMAEEYNEELRFFIQPIREQRDALEHIVRALSLYYENPTGLTEDDERQISKNLSSALGHIFRAFFDSADVLSVELRYDMSQILKKYSYKKIIEVWPNYEAYRKIIIKMPDDFVKLRCAKDISKSNDEIREKVNFYNGIISQLYEIYKEFKLNVEPKLN